MIIGALLGVVAAPLPAVAQFKPIESWRPSPPPAGFGPTVVSAVERTRGRRGRRGRHLEGTQELVRCPVPNFL
jgi:hypothetical protein